MTQYKWTNRNNYYLYWWHNRNNYYLHWWHNTKEPIEIIIICIGDNINEPIKIIIIICIGNIIYKMDIKEDQRWSQSISKASLKHLRLIQSV